MMYRFSDAANYERIRDLKRIFNKTGKENIDFNAWYGNTFVSRFEEGSGQSKYVAKCKCGETMLLTVKEMEAKQFSKTGCRSVNCTAETVQEKLEGDFYMALKYQHFILLTATPSFVCSWWGGSADDGTRTSWQIGNDRFAQFVYNSSLTPTVRENFITRINKDLPYMEGNLKFSDLPEQTVRRTIGRVKIAIGGVVTDANLTQYKKLVNTPDVDLTVRAFQKARYTPGLFNL